MLRSAFERVGRLSEPSKMPCYAYSLPEFSCVSGQKLRHVKGSVCSRCYARRGHYTLEKVKRSQIIKLDSILNDMPTLENWTRDMTTVIGTLEGSGYFRWHDSGDILGQSHLKALIQIAINLPHIQFWLPTHEYKTIKEFLKEGEFPDNLIVRISAAMIDRPAPDLGLPTGTVSKYVMREVRCRAIKSHRPEAGVMCGPCRLCWDKSTPNIDYKLK